MPPARSLGLPLASRCGFSGLPACPISGIGIGIGVGEHLPGSHASSKPRPPAACGSRSAATGPRPQMVPFGGTRNQLVLPLCTGMCLILMSLLLKWGWQRDPGCRVAGQGSPRGHLPCPGARHPPGAGHLRPRAGHRGPAPWVGTSARGFAIALDEARAIQGMSRGSNLNFGHHRSPSRPAHR